MTDVFTNFHGVGFGKGFDALATFDGKAHCDRLGNGEFFSHGLDPLRHLRSLLGLACGLIKLRPDGLPVVGAQVLAGYSTFCGPLDGRGKLWAWHFPASENLVEVLLRDAEPVRYLKPLRLCDLVHAAYSIVSIDMRQAFR